VTLSTFLSNAACCNVLTGLLVSEVLSTLDKPTVDLVILWGLVADMWLE
jgi:hypothetical protein